jgi:hypothetical protein
VVTNILEEHAAFIFRVNISSVRMQSDYTDRLQEGWSLGSVVGEEEIESDPGQ